ncbi:MAG: glycosyltransferase family 4 protein [Opitutae bacterium]|nr:glycosyltransferase family 4 protein [Opitutae bacterium]
MKLLFVHDRFGAQAGAESNLYHTAAALQRRGHQLALAHGPGTGKAEEDWEKVFPERLRILAENSSSSMDAALDAFLPEVVYLHNAPDLGVVEGLAKSAVPTVRMVHDHRLFCLRGCKYPVWSRRPCPRALSPFCLFPCGGLLQRAPGGSRKFQLAGYLAKKRELELHRGFRRLLVASEYMRAELLRNGIPAERIEIHPPVPPAAAAPAPDFGPRNLIVFAGQLVRGKGVDVLLEALALVEAPFECVIFGDGHQRAECEALSRRLGLAGRVEFRGYRPQAELADCYRAASLAVVSSVWPEPFGATGLEAMRCGLPVVAFNVGGISEWLLDFENGLLVPWMDRALFAQSIDLLLADKALARHLGARGRQLASERFDFARYVDRLEAVFLRLAERRVSEGVA